MSNPVRRLLRPLRRLVEQTRVELAQAPYKHRRSEPGSERWLIESEVHYGGYTNNVRRNRVSPHDPRSRDQLAQGGMIGGDRMLFHGYAEYYAKFLKPFVDLPRVTLAEFGILRGTGLATWCDLFPDGSILGFDVDLEHFNRNRHALEGRGAFAISKPEVYEYDQFEDGSARLGAALRGRTLDVVIDDGFHSAETIINTWRSARQFLSARFVYFVEDFDGLLDAHKSEFNGYDCAAFGEFTVIGPGHATL